MKVEQLIKGACYDVLFSNELKSNNRYKVEFVKTEEVDEYVTLLHFSEQGRKVIFDSDFLVDSDSVKNLNKGHFITRLIDKNVFEILGYHIDYYVGNSYKGSVKVDSPDRELFGYYGRRNEVLKNDLVFGKKKIKAGESVTTELQKICGKVVNNPFSENSTLENKRLC